MAYKRREHDRACRCDQADGSCAALAVQRPSRTRVQELAEEIWTVSTGTLAPVQPIRDPRSSRPAPRPKPPTSAAVATRNASSGATAGGGGGGRAWWPPPSSVLGCWSGGGFDFHPSGNARYWRQAAVQRRTAGVLAQLEQEGWLVLHDVALPGWSASLDHLVIGPTGAWAIESWRNSWLPRRRKTTGHGVVGGPRPDLSWKAAAIADSLAGTGIPVRPLLCLHVGIRPPGRRAVQGIPLVVLRRLPDVVRNGSRVQPIQAERACARALEVLRPAA